MANKQLAGFNSWLKEWGSTIAAVLLIAVMVAVAITTPPEQDLHSGWARSSMETTNEQD